MSIDTSEFLDVLMEDSLEALNEMETSLLDLDHGGDDAELINTIFRGAHSIKGGSGMLGLDEIASFTHLMETLLDEVREGKRTIDMLLIGLLLECVDALRGMFDALKDQTENDQALVASLVERLQAVLENREPVLAAAPTPASEPEPEPELQELQELPELQEVIAEPEPIPATPVDVIESAPAAIIDLPEEPVHVPVVEPVLATPASPSGNGNGWAIQFIPDHDVFVSGQDPQRFIQQLATLGRIQVTCDINVMPGFERLNPELCFLAWDIELETDVDQDQVRQIFAPVANQCELIIESLSDYNAMAGADADQAADAQGQDAISYLKEAVMGGPVTQVPAEAMPELEIPEPAPASEPVVEPAELFQPEVAMAEPVSVEAEPEPPVMPVVEEKPVEVKSVEPAPVVNEQSAVVAEKPVAAVAAADALPKEAESKPTPPPAPTRKKETKKSAAAKRGSQSEAGSIRVSTQKIDALINMAGELVITQAMLAQLGEKLEESGLQDLEQLRDGLAQLERNSRELQDAVMSIRMLPISFAFSRFPRMIRDLNTKMNKKVELVTSGEQTELDKTVMEKIGDPLVHLVRNGFDHGIEMPADRLKAGKPETGTIELNAYHQGGNIVIEVVDDGKGLDREKIVAKARERGLIGEDEQVPDDQALELIFEPGFSTAEQVSDLSGRGVGMDVVRRNIRDLGGHIEVASEVGVGSTFTIRLPLTLAILDGQLVTVGDETFIVPLISIVESLQIRPELLNTVGGRTELYQLRDEYIPVVKLSELFDIKTDHMSEYGQGLLVVVEGDGKKIGLKVDDLLGQQQAFIKSLETNYKPVTGISGATILGDGTVSLILDAGAIVRLSGHSKG